MQTSPVPCQIYIGFKIKTREYRFIATRIWRLQEVHIVLQTGDVTGADQIRMGWITEPVQAIQNTDLG